MFHDMGTGKTRTAIEIFGSLRVNNPKLVMLVFAPLSLLNAAWGEDIKKFSTFNYWNLREKLANDPANPIDIILANYEFLLSQKNINKLLLMATEFKANYQDIMCVLDESSRIKNNQAKTTKTILKLTTLFKHRIVMSGTPAPNSEMEYWPQIQFTSPGLLGNSMSAFRAKYFHMARGKQAQPIPQFMSRQIAYDTFRKGWNYAITKDKRDELIKTIMPHCHVVKKEDCLDLPDQVDEIREVILDAPQMKIYKEMEKNLITEINNKQIAAPIALTKIMKLRELSSGFAIDENNIIHEMPGTNKKLKELISVIEEADDQPIIVFANFVWEVEKIYEILSKIAPTSTLYSGTKYKDESIQNFINGKTRFMIGNSHSMSHGLTFIQCSLQVFFSLDYSAETYFQARDRIHRVGQKKTCVYVHLIAKDTIDSKILKILKEKGNMSSILWSMSPK